MVNERYTLIPSRETEDQRILEPNGTKSTPGLNQAKTEMLTSCGDYRYAKNQRYGFVFYSDIANQIMLQSNRTKSTFGHIQPKMWDAAFHWRITPFKQTEISIAFFEKYCQLKNHVIWLNKKQNKSDSIDHT